MIWNVFENMIPHIYSDFFNIKVEKNWDIKNNNFKFHYIIWINDIDDYQKKIDELKRILNKKKFNKIEIDNINILSSTSLLIDFITYNIEKKDIYNESNKEKFLLLFSVLDFIGELDVSFKLNDKKKNISKVIKKESGNNIKKYFSYIDNVIELSYKNNKPITSIDFDIWEDDFMFGLNIIVNTDKEIIIPETLEKYVDVIDNYEDIENSYVIFIKDFEFDYMEENNIIETLSIEELINISIRFLKYNNII